MLRLDCQKERRYLFSISPIRTIVLTIYQLFKNMKSEAENPERVEGDVKAFETTATVVAVDITVLPVFQV